MIPLLNNAPSKIFVFYTCKKITLVCNYDQSVMIETNYFLIAVNGLCAIGYIWSTYHGT